MASSKNSGNGLGRESCITSCPRSVEDLDDILTSPSSALVRGIRTLEGPLVILGAGGKMGPSLAVLAVKAARMAGCRLRVVAVSRFSDPTRRQWLERQGVETISCDLFDPKALARLPDSSHLIYLVGLKFGTSSNPSATWAANTIIPGNVASRYPGSRIVVLSTGNVYPFTPVDAGGALETTPLMPLGEYPNAAVARERLFEWHAGRLDIRLTILRLNYAVDLRYGVPHDIARKVWAGEPVDLENGHFNCIWQGDANDMILRSLDLAENPPAVFNLTGPEIVSVRSAARKMGELMGCKPRFVGTESPTALLSNSSRLFQVLGRPAVSVPQMLAWTASWVMRGGSSLNKPTHFEVRNGRF